MRTIQLAGAGAVALAMLTIPAAAVADPVVPPPGTCAAPVQWVAARGPAGGHDIGTCPPQARWVPARGPAGGHYDYPASRCVRWVPARGPAGGHYVGTCPTHLRWVPARGPAGGHYEYTGAPAIQSATKPPVTSVQTSGAPSWGLDWGSAGIGAATVLGALAIALAALVGLRRRRIARPRAVTTH